VADALRAPAREDSEVRRRIDAAEECLALACNSQSLMRIHDMIGRALRQLEAAKRAALAPGLQNPPASPIH